MSSGRQARSSQPKETPLSPLTLLASPAGRWLLGGAVATVAALGLWLYVSGLQTANARLASQLADVTAINNQLVKNVTVLGDELAAAEARAEFSASIKEEIYAIPPSETGVPADIRAALERLRHD